MLKDGKADFIAIGKQLLADPQWPNKVKEGKLEDIRPCLGDHACFERIAGRKYLSCTVNPATGMEKELALTPAEKPKSVLVVGGGDSALEAADSIADEAGTTVAISYRSEAFSRAKEKNRIKERSCRP